MEAPGDFGSDVAGHGDAVINGDAVDGDEGNHIGRAHARVRALVPGKVNQLGGLAYTADNGLFDGFPLAHQRDDRAVVVGIHLPVKKIDAGNLHGFDDGIDFARVAAFGEIGNAFDKSAGHGQKNNDPWRNAATGLQAGKENPAKQRAEWHFYRRISAYFPISSLIPHS
jgi:hypothetical protein